MQPTTLNKVVSLFLVGGVVLLLLVCILWDLKGSAIISYDMLDILKQAGPAFVAVVGGLALASLAAILGLVCEAFTDLTVRKLIKKAAESETGAGFFLQKDILAGHNRWRDVFNSALWKDQRLGNPLSDCHDRSAAAGIFYTSAADSSTAWVDSHYATYILCSNMGFVVVALDLYVLAASIRGIYSWYTLLVCTLVSLFLFYAFCSLALDRYLYTYLFTFRHSGLTLLTRAEKVAPGDGGRITPA